MDRLWEILEGFSGQIVVFLLIFIPFYLFAFLRYLFGKKPEYPKKETALGCLLYVILLSFFAYVAWEFEKKQSGQL